MKLLMLLAIFGFSLFDGLPAAQSQENFHFAVIGNWGESFYWHEDSPQWRVATALDDWASRHDGRFILTTGNNFSPDGVRSTRDAWFDQKWVRVYDRPNIRDLQWRLALGDNDYAPKNDRPSATSGGNEMFQVKRSEIDSRWYLPSLWYKFTEPSPAGDVDFFVIDTEAIRREYNNYTDQYAWLERELNTSTASVKFVVGHHPVYTVGDDAPGYNELWSVIEPLMLEYNVDAYLTGHDGGMSHLWYMDGSGHDYIIIAGGGQEIFPENRFWADRFREENGLNSTHFESYGFAGIHVTTDTIVTHFYDDEGTFFYEIERPVKAK